MMIEDLSRVKLFLLSTVAIGATTNFGMAPPAKAQALQPVVDVCSGITLPRSAVTEVISAVNAPIVSQIETTVNQITTVTLILNPLATISDLNIDLTSILANAAAGDPISLQILDTNGNVITASDDCNITADAITLNEQGGIAIGGNRITGLGADGQIASAGENDAIAFGNNASTAVGATGAVAIGTGSSATAANSVALGAGSIADRGAQAGYSAPGLAGTFNSAGTVSVGSGGAERQIVNVAPGTADTDAATVGQLTGAIALGTANAVQYDNLAHDLVTLDGGAGGTVIANLGAGAVNAGSFDAVNGSQLYATDQLVVANSSAIAVLDGRVDVNETAISNLVAAVTTNQTDITNIDARVTDNEVDITALQDASVMYDDASHGVVTFDGAGGTLLTNVKAGTLSAASSDAINGAQLFATNQAVTVLDSRVTQNETDITNNTAAISNLQTSVGDVQATIVTYENRITQNETDITSIDGRVTTNEGDISNLAGRVTSNEGDIVSIDSRVTVSEAAISTLDIRMTDNEGNIANIDGRVTVNEGDITAIDSRVVSAEANITTLQAQVANSPVNYVSNADGMTRSNTPTDTAAFTGPSNGSVRVTNVANGVLSAGSTDAVNGSQLSATNELVAKNTADITTISNNISGNTVVAIQYSNPQNATASNGGTISNDVTLTVLRPEHLSVCTMSPGGPRGRMLSMSGRCRLALLMLCHHHAAIPICEWMRFYRISTRKWATWRSTWPT